MPERDLQSATLDLAALLKWRCYHTFDSRRSHKGFPDVVAVRGKRVLWIEFKSATGKLSAEQSEWAAALLLADQEWYEFRPADWYSGEIERVLRGDCPSCGQPASDDVATGNVWHGCES